MKKIVGCLLSIALVSFSSASHCQECPKTITSVPLPGEALDVTLFGEYLLVAGSYAGLRILDVSVPTSAHEIGFFDTPGRSADVAVSGQYALVADWWSLRIIDLTNPEVPIETGHWDAPMWAYGVDASGSFAYVANYISGLRVIDISNPALPTEVGAYFPGTVPDLTVDGGLAYLAVGFSPQRGLSVVDISDPSTPVPMGAAVTDENAWGVAVSDGYAYVAVGNFGQGPENGGLHVIDVSDPSQPLNVGYCPLPRGAYDVAVSGPYAYVADTSGGLRLIDVSDPTDPREIGSNNQPIERAFSVVVEGDFGYVADQNDQVVVVRGFPFADACWKRGAPDAGTAPGLWCSDASSAWTDRQGLLHLTIKEHQGEWCGAAATLMDYAGTGRHLFWTSTNLNSSLGGPNPGTLDPDVVFAMSLSRTSATGIDIQFTDALDANDGSSSPLDHGVFTARKPGTLPPCDPLESQCDFQPAMTHDLSTHVMDWSETNLQLTSWYGHCTEPPCEGVMKDWTYTGSKIPLQNEGLSTSLSLWICADAGVCSDEPHNDHTVTTEQHVLIADYSGWVDAEIIFIDDFESGGTASWGMSASEGTH